MLTDKMSLPKSVSIQEKVKHQSIKVVSESIVVTNLSHIANRLETKTPSQLESLIEEILTGNTCHHTPGST